MFLGYEPFCAQIKSLFGADVNSHDVKALFRKIAANPEAEVDWSEVQNMLALTHYRTWGHAISSPKVPFFKIKQWGTCHFYWKRCPYNVVPLKHYGASYIYPSTVQLKIQVPPLKSDRELCHRLQPPLPSDQ